MGFDYLICENAEVNPIVIKPNSSLRKSEFGYIPKVSQLHQELNAHFLIKEIAISGAPRSHIYKF